MHQVLIMPRFARLTIALGLATAVFPVDAEYYFNPRFLSNDLAESVDLSAFTKGREAPPGTYRVDIYLNDEFMTSRDITFIADDNNAELIPCLSTDLLVSLGIKKIALLDNKEHSAEKHVPDNSACTPLQDRLADASTEFDVGQQHLSLSVPQIYVGRMARGYVSPDLWEEGINAGLLNYSFNGNSINNRSNHNAGKSNYAYLNLQSGINIGSWRLRDNSTWSYYSGSSNSSDSNKWQHINTSAERDIIPLRSRLTVGDSYTDGDMNGHTSCIFQESCKDNLVVESNGDIYECDHFVYPQYKIGNINKSELKTMNSVQLTAQKKRISAKCLKCAYKPICNGGCPKHRITKVNNVTVSYFCEGYKILFSTMVPYMNAMVELAKNRVPLYHIMDVAKQMENN